MSDSVNVQVIIMKHLCLLFSLTKSIYKLLWERHSEADTRQRTPSGGSEVGGSKVWVPGLRVLMNDRITGTGHPIPQPQGKGTVAHFDGDILVGVKKKPQSFRGLPIFLSLLHLGRILSQSAPHNQFFKKTFELTTTTKKKKPV